MVGGGRQAVGSSVLIIHCSFEVMNQRSIVCSVESRVYFFTYVNYYHALTLKKDARIFTLVISGVLFPAALLSFTLLLYDFHKGEVGVGKKYAKLANCSAISRNSGVQKGMAPPATQMRDLWQPDPILR